MNYNFTLIYHLPPEDADQDALIERFGEAGHTDMLIGIGISGCLALGYLRPAKDADEALQSAMAEVSHIVPGATLLEATAVTFVPSPRTGT